MARGRPIAHEIANQLRAAISAGDYAPGQRLPSRAALAERHGVAELTITHAIDQLRREGLVEGRAGSGVFVRHPARVMRSSRARLSRAERAAGRGAFLTDAHAGGWTARSEVVVRTEPGGDDIAAQLGIAPGASVLVRERTMYADDAPVQLATSYLPADLTTPAMAERDTGPGGLYALIEDAGLSLEHFEETVRTGHADPTEAAALNAAAGTVVLRLVRRAYTVDRVIEVNHITMLGERYELHYELPAS